MYKWFLAWRYMHTKLIAFFGVASVMLCVAMVLVVVSVMGGFLDTIRARSRGLHSEVVLEAGTLQGFPYYDEFAQRLIAGLGDAVTIATPAIYTYGIFRVPVDRTFSVKGYGTVATGIPVAGSVRIGDEVVLLPQGSRGRVSGIQVYSRTGDTAVAGQCAALVIRKPE